MSRLHPKILLKKFIIRIKPYFSFLPKGVRLRIGSALRCLTGNQIKRPPEPYSPGLFSMGINLFGLFRAAMGLAQGAKLYAHALECGKIPHVLLNLDFLEWLAQNDHSYDSQLVQAPVYAVNVVHINPDQWREAIYPFGLQAFDQHYNIGVWLWELETVPQKWLPILAYVDELWVPSQFIAKALHKVTDKPVTVIPYGISVPFDETATRASLGLPEDRFCVLVMYDSNSYASRKNPAAAIKAYAKAFGKQNSATHLVIKVNNPKQADIQFFEREIEDRAGYTLITEQMEKPRLNALIRLCDVFISLHRSEGFGLVMAEAMALGTPVIATDWSANTEFMTRETSCMVNYQLVPVRKQYQYGEASQRWAEADIDQAAEYLKRLLGDKTYYRKKAEAGRAWITSRFSPEESARKMRSRLEEICNIKSEADLHT